MNKKSNILLFSLVSAVSLLGCTGCPGEGGNSNSQTPSASETPSEESLPEPSDPLELIPDDVKNYKGDIDFVIYIEGKNDTKADIGSSRYTKDDIEAIEMAKYFAAARAWKEVSPGTKINLIYCNIADYNNLITSYTEQKGHYPHLMWATDHVVEMMQNGIYTDLSCYADTEYYQSYNQYLMSRFNYGGFQGGFPIASEPWGVFVNLDALDTYKIVDTTDAEAYKDWVDNFTWDAMLDACKESTSETHAGISKVVDFLLSYSVESITKQFLEEGSVELNTQIVKSLLEKENELTKYAVYDYTGGITTSNIAAKEQFPNAHNWSGTPNFAEDQYCTFYAEAPWAIGTISQYITERPELNTRVDYLPYPKVDKDTPAYTGIAVEGVGVGNLCPIGEDGNEHCYSTSAKLEQKVAAYFAMFMGADARSIKNMSEIEYVHNGTEYVGSMSLPLIKKDFRFSWQDDEDKVAALEAINGYGDPSQGYKDNFSYQLAKYFDVYSVYVTNDEEPDVTYFSNITYGLTKILDSVYGDDVRCLNFWNEPVNIPEGAGIKDIFDDWQTRYTTYELGGDTYVSNVIAELSRMEEEINNDTETAWELIQDMLDMFYGEGNYDVSDHSERNNY